MGRFGFCGPSYTSQSVTADCQRSMNWYPESIESQLGKSAMALYPTPGLTLFTSISGPIRGMLEINGRMFAVGAGTLYEVLATPSVIERGTVGNDGKPA